jgi:hypothetical protein
LQKKAEPVSEMNGFWKKFLRAQYRQNHETFVQIQNQLYKLVLGLQEQNTKTKESVCVQVNFVCHQDELLQELAPFKSTLDDLEVDATLPALVVENEEKIAVEDIQMLQQRKDSVQQQILVAEKKGKELCAFSNKIRSKRQVEKETLVSLSCYLLPELSLVVSFFL